MKSLRLGALALSIAVTGCAQIPDSALALSPTSFQQRQIETRRFDGISESDLLAACAAVLQDLGFNIDNSESRLGLITASKDRSAWDTNQFLRGLALAMIGVHKPLDKDQTIRASVVVFPAGTHSGQSHFVRITLQRIVRTTNLNFTRSEWLKDPELYQGFFAKLSQAVFLEGHKI
jgi:hypothetical protein